MTALLNIAALSRRTGVEPDTLRKWESRYAVLQPERSAGGQRRYTEQDVARVEWLTARLGEGWRIGEAARMLAETPTVPLSDPGALVATLVDACRANDPGRLDAPLDQAFAVLPVARLLDEVIAPTMRAVGDDWHAGRVSIAAEHAVTAKVRARLERLMADHRGATRGRAVLACAPGEHHDLGLLMLAVRMRADGWGIEYLGANVPVATTLELAESIGADLICFSASRPETFGELAAGLNSAAGHTPAVVVGGAGARTGDIKALGASRAPTKLDDAISQLRRIVP